jgi:hypothetical protein
MAEDVLERQYGKLLRPVLKQEFKNIKMKKYEFNLNCERFSTLNYDISISGLGWFSLSGKGFTQILVSVPEGVKVSLREKPLMPYEIRDKGLKKYFGNTLNRNSKINTKFNEPKSQPVGEKKKGENLIKLKIKNKKLNKDLNKNI